MDLVISEALARRVAADLKATTHDRIELRNGPSSPTLTKITTQIGESIAPSTVRALERAFDWPEGMVAALCGEVGVVRSILRLTPAQLAERMGVSAKAVERWEASGSVPADVVAAMTEIFDELRRSAQQTVSEATDTALLEELLRRARARV